MPQGRRKVPFSGKAKKEQMKARKEKRTTAGHKIPFLQRASGDSDADDVVGGSGIHKLNYQPTNKGGGTGRPSSKPNRYALQFFRESNDEIMQKKEQARHGLKPVKETELEIEGSDFFEEKLDFPKRPPWNFDLPKEQLDSQENRYFHEYIKNIEKNYDIKDLSYFELNLETWRQLWRVLEMSDIVLFIVDVRYAGAMFPPSLYKYVTEDLGKDFILLLNKIDLAPAPLVAAWKHYFEEKYPLLKICMFTSLPGYNLIGKKSDKGGLQVRRRKGRIRMAAEGTQKLVEVCDSLVGSKVDLSSWKNKVKEEIQESFADEGVEIKELLHTKNETEYYHYEKYREGVLTIGCIGQPNVGKSSLMNAIMGKKVVSVSKTPGHTKHFQTIFLTNNVRLCDCPGLVFPSKVPKPLQVLMGSFPIAQLREPYMTIKFLAERLDMPQLLRIQHPDNDETWSAMDICDGWAKKRGYLTAKAARLDSYRAANSLLRMALDGKICLCLRPPGYIKDKTLWQNHPDNGMVRWIQAITDGEEAHIDEAVGFDSDHSSNDEGVDEEDHDGEEGSNEDSAAAAEPDISEDSVDDLVVSANQFAALMD